MRRGLPYDGPIMPKSKSGAPEAEADAPVIVGSQEAFERFLPDAEALGADAVQPFRADAMLAYHNVDRGLDAIAPFIDQIKQELPTIHVQQLAELSDLALAVIFAASQIDRSSDGSTAETLAEARTLRTLLLASADALAAAGLLPARAVRKIHEGSGPLDAAQDCVDLAALFSKHSKDIKGKSAVSSSQVTKAAKVGTELLKRLKKKGAKAKKDPDVALAVGRRDRLWTMLVERHKELRRVGMWLWLDEVDAHVPKIQSRLVSAKKKKKPEEPAPTGD
jgi:hypothetical protein